jgi:lipoprotein-anchoring transpeptidase ErfK/SrfK
MPLLASAIRPRPERTNVGYARGACAFRIRLALVYYAGSSVVALFSGSPRAAAAEPSPVAEVREHPPSVVFPAPVVAIDPSPTTGDATASAPVPDAGPPAPASDDIWLHAQVALTRRLFSCGPIDGVHGAQTTAALYAFQESQKLAKTGELDVATRSRLFDGEESPLTEITLSTEDFSGLQPLSPTWLGKSEQAALGYETVLELIAERFHVSPTLLRRLNPTASWEELLPGAKITVPAVQLPSAGVKAGRLHIRLADRTLQLRDEQNALIAHFPVSIARKAEKRPEGELHVTVVIENPDYTFDPELFNDSAEAQSVGRKLILPPGPNNPVGVAWIGLDREGYGIHGTPSPEKVGRTESHGCFRLANWDARTLLAMAWKGLPVLVDP